MFDTAILTKHVRIHLIFAFGENIASHNTCKYWFSRFKNGYFDTSDRPRSGMPRKFESQMQVQLNKKNPEAREMGGAR